MANIRVYLPEETLAKFRKAAMSRFGYGKGSLSTAAEVAISGWLAQEDYVELWLKKIKTNAEDDKNVLAVFLFGSYVKNKTSYGDVDIAILLRKDDVDSPTLLAGYSDPKGLFDTSIMNRLPMNIQSRVISEGALLYCADKAKIYDYCIDLMEKWGDFKPRFSRILARRAR